MAALRHYLQPGPRHTVSGQVLTAPVRREPLVPAEIALVSSREAGLVELPVQVDPGDIARGLTEQARRIPAHRTRAGRLLPGHLHAVQRRRSEGRGHPSCGGW